MNKDIEYNIEFFSEWHCGSGLAAGADVDALVIKDKDGLPFVPGKTIKGLIKEAIENIIDLKNNKNINLNDAFGLVHGQECVKEGCMYFSNAILPDHDNIAMEKLQEYMYRNFSSTCIDDNGIAQKHSLRRVETVIPCNLIGKITNVPEELVDVLVSSFGLIKRMGVNRNRGLGRCRISKISEEETK
jgi:hypothetical protein